MNIIKLMKKYLLLELNNYAERMIFIREFKDSIDNLSDEINSLNERLSNIADIEERKKVSEYGKGRLI